MAFSELTGVPWEVLEAKELGLFGNVDAFMESYELGTQALYWDVQHDSVMTHLDEIVRSRIGSYDHSATPDVFDGDDYASAACTGCGEYTSGEACPNCRRD